MGGSEEGRNSLRFMRFLGLIVRMELGDQPRGHEVTLGVPGYDVPACDKQPVAVLSCVDWRLSRGLFVCKRSTNPTCRYVAESGSVRSAVNPSGEKWSCRQAQTEERGERQRIAA
jgi:hypothetical protein